MSEQTTHPFAPAPQVRLGELLHAHRIEKKIDLQSMGRTLILSTAQITAIENGSQTSFHNTSFYLRALKKYLEHFRLAPEAEENLLFAQIDQTIRNADIGVNTKEVDLLVQSNLSHTRQSYFSGGHRRFRLWFGLAIFLCAALVATYMVLPRQQSDSTAEIKTTTIVQAPPAPVLTPTLTTPTITPPAITSTLTTQTEKNIARETSPPPTSTQADLNPAPSRDHTLKFTFNAASWVQAVDQTGKRIEKVFTPQDGLALDPDTLISLVIGNARETRLSVGTLEIDLTKYVNAGSGVARLTQQDLSGLIVPER